MADSKSTAAAVEMLADEITARNPVLAKRELSIYDVNESLSQISDAELSDEELENLLRSCSSAREVFWLLNILIRNIERALSTSSTQLINWVHPHGMELRQTGTNLKRICQLAAEGKLSDDSSLLFKMFEPMLLSRIKHGTRNVYDTLVQFCGRQFYMEVKYDGEHFVIHRGEGGEMRYFSRAQNDFTNTIAPNLDYRIDPFFADSLKNCILDVELLLWDTIDECYVGKGRQAADGRIYDVKHLRPDGAVEPCVVVFDVLFLNDESLMNVPLKKRLEYLESGSVLKKQDNKVLFVSKCKLVSSREEFAKIYEESVKEGEEGVVAKKIDSVYRTGARQMTNGWFKIKPFHLGNETLDLAIVGVDRGRDGKISNYSVATLREDKYFMVGKVGTGLNETTRNFLKNRLVRNHGFLKGDRIPDWIHRDFRTEDLPTDYIHKDNFQVVEIRAKGLMNGRLYAPTLRFYRDDKFVKDINNYEDFIDFDKNLRADSITNALSTIDPRKRTAPAHVAEDYKVKKAHTDKVSDDLKGMQLCVLKGSADINTQDVHEIIASFGGSHVANPGPKTVLVITGDANHVKSKSVIRSNKLNVVSTDWVIACRDAGRVLPICKADAVHVVDDKLFQMFTGSDTATILNAPKAYKYTVADVSAMFEKTKALKKKKATAAEENLRKRLLKDDKYERFYGQTFYVHGSVGENAKVYAQVLLKMHGANLSKILNTSVNYIIADKKKAPENLSKKGLVVDVAWVENYIK